MICIVCYVKRGENLKQDSLGRTFKMINNIFEYNCNKNLAELNLTHSQIEILIFIHLNSKKGVETNQMDIEKHFNLKNPTVTGIINRLEEKELLVRLPSSKGANYKKIELTETANDLLKKGLKLAIKGEKEIFGVLEETEQYELQRLLNKVLENYQKNNIK